MLSSQHDSPVAYVQYGRPLNGIFYKWTDGTWVSVCRAPDVARRRHVGDRGLRWRLEEPLLSVLQLQQTDVSSHLEAVQNLFLSRLRVFGIGERRKFLQTQTWTVK